MPTAVRTAVDESPPFAPGDYLSRAEFLRRWEQHPEIKKAELIGGIVYMASPVAFEHGDMENHVGTWLGVYQAHTPGCAGGHNTTSFLLEDTPQPDLNLRILPECGGATRTEGKYLSGPPEFIAEICRSSASYDLHQKLELYEAAGVQEYMAVLLYEQEIRWHVLQGGDYRLLAPDADKILRSRVFPGLWLAGDSLLSDKMSQVLTTLQLGLDSDEHRRFVKKLADKKSATKRGKKK